MNIFAKNVNFLKKHDIFLHDARILLLMYILIFWEHLFNVVHIILQLLTLICILAMKISVSLLILNFFFDIFLMKADDSLLQLFEISDVMKTFENIILELLFEALLFV